MTKTPIKIKPNKVFSVKGRTYAYMVEDGAILEVSKDIGDILSCRPKEMHSLANNMETEHFQALINSLHENDLLQGSSEIAPSDNTLVVSSLSAMTLMVSQECNMNCHYCYGDGGEYQNHGMMSLETALLAVDFLVANSTENDLHIAFLGGEPLLSFPLICKIVEYCDTVSATTAKKFTFTITTNGTLLNDEIVSFLTTHHVACQISLDGNRTGNDENRYFKNKKGSYDQVIQKTSTLRSSGHTTARATITPGNYDYIEIFNHLDNLGFRAIPIAIANNLVDDQTFLKILVMYQAYIRYFSSLLMVGNYQKAEL